MAEIICSMPGCDTTAGCKCSFFTRWERIIKSDLGPTRSLKPQTNVRELVTSMGYDPFLSAVDELVTVAKGVLNSNDGNELEQSLECLESAVVRMQREIERARGASSSDGSSRVPASSLPRPPSNSEAK